MRKNLRPNGFTLIELMVVVAVIAILATLGVSNFSAAIRRTRNAGRQADVEAVAKALETCYDVPSGTYNGGLGESGTATVTSTTTVTTGPFAVEDNTCLNEDILPDMADYNYEMLWTTEAPQRFVVCAQLEPVANWDGIGNTATIPTITNGTVTMGAACGEPTGTNTCYFCVQNQQ